MTHQTRYAIFLRRSLSEQPEHLCAMDRRAYRRRIYAVKIGILALTAIALLLGTVALVWGMK